MRKLATYFYLFLAIFFSYVICHGFAWDENTPLIHFVMFITPLSLLLSLQLFYSSRYKALKQSPQDQLSLIIFLGFVLRIGYMLYTRCDVRYHDLGYISLDGHGHAGYLLTLIYNKHLPESNLFQFYQPPLYYLLGSVTSWAANAMIGHHDYMCYVNASKIISCFASCSILLLCKALCKEVHLKPTSQVITLMIIAFSPSLVIIGGTVNNDALVTFFMVAAILYTYRWYEAQSYKNTIILALIFGLGLMTKTSMVYIACFTALVILNVILKTLRSKEKAYLALFKRIGLFALISLPLGLWYQIRNYVRFDQPFGYVYRIAETEPIYCGDVPFFQRFLKVDIANLLASPFATPNDDYNLPAYIIKTSLFGEFKLDVPKWIPILLVFINIVLILFSIYALYLLLSIKKDHATFTYRGMIGFWLFTLIFNVYFNITYPFGCTMDFRYMLVLQITGAFFLGLTYKTELPIKLEESGLQPMIYHLYEHVLPWAVLLFSSLSYLMLLLLK